MGCTWEKRIILKKFTLWERSTRVPLIISYPGVITAETSCNQPVSLMETLAELTGFEKPNHLDGESLVPQIKNPNTPKAPS